jgi:uncharacterized protein (TIGR02453 family)
MTDDTDNSHEYRYITTTLPYINGQPHLGHAFEFVRADAVARFKRLEGFTVFFNTGTDEHGQKVLKKAEEEGISVEDFADKYSQNFKDLLADLNISNDAFVRTTDDSHKKAAQEFWKRCAENGDIYKAKYKINISGLVAADVKSDSEPSYYFSIQPGGHSFLGGGLFMPERMVLSDIRDKIEMYPKALAKIDHSKEMRTEFPDGLSRAHTLKTAPRGHDVEHEAIEYLRLKSLTVGKNISDSELKNPAFTKNVIQSFKSVYQLNKFLRP